MKSRKRGWGTIFVHSFLLFFFLSFRFRATKKKYANNNGTLDVSFFQKNNIKSDSNMSMGSGVVGTGAD